MPVKETTTIEVGPVSAETGEVARGFLNIGETATGPVQLPLVIVNGVEPGPTLCLTAGVHATEYASIAALMKLTNEVQPNQLRGSIIAVPIVNLHMFAARTPFTSPLDGVNLNKIAPGGEGSISEILARALFEQVLSKAQYHIDMHAGDFGEMLLAFAGYSLTGNHERDLQGETLARLWTPQVFCLAPAGTGLPPSPGFVAYAGARKGVVSILAEAGGNGGLDDADIRTHYDGVRNVMRYLGMIDGNPQLRPNLLSATGWHNTRAKRAGLLRLKVSVGDKIAAGQGVAEVCDVFGRVVETVRAAKPGLAMLVWSHKAVNTGDPIVRCWSTKPAGPFAETDRFGPGA
ncbi:MAG TPA: succinylglutamate desuccinylase/aspartoacylase family protein [Verrucomicrobiae bacterium]|jgi:predicted deacylase|nr:succinylglutamate desuccinylase/aspartoacylase family protein [Verrucomicrobiae bacterium]